MRYDIAIVGAGHAGAQAAIALRQAKFVGSIALIGDEDEPPYERPPLSKDYLAGEKPFERILIRPLAFWRERGIDLLPGRRVVDVNPEAHAIATLAGEQINYGRLIWATGGYPRSLTCTGHNLPGVHAVRTRADVDRILGELDRIVRVIVIGGGYIGLEAAAALSKLGKSIVVIEAAPRVLARVAGEPLSRFFEREHAEHGVDIRLGIGVDCILEKAGRAAGVRLADRTEVHGDIVIVGIGIVPAVEPLVEAGAAGTNGVDVDNLCRTTLPDVYAIGDCAAQENGYANCARIRLESVQNANDQALAAARAITGGELPQRTVPWFWSNQFDLRLQTIGLSSGHDATVVRGSPEDRSFSVVYLKGGQVVALDCVNATKDYVQGRRLIETAARIPPARLADLTVPLKDLV